MGVTYTTTASYAAVTGTKINMPRGARAVAVQVTETGGANGGTFKVQGSLDGSNWTDLTVYDATSTIESAADVAVSAGTTVPVFMSQSATKFATGCYTFYQIQAKDTSGGSHAVLNIVGPTPICG
jgi:hypothetical protein